MGCEELRAIRLLRRIKRFCSVVELVSEDHQRMGKHHPNAYNLWLQVVRNPAAGAKTSGTMVMIH